MMNREIGSVIGAEIGEFLDVETDEDGMAYGWYLRVKVGLEIAKPLMRSKMVQIGDEGQMRWCSFEYEFLTDFCFTCGIIGHTNKSCSTKLKKGETQQYGKWLKRNPHQRGREAMTSVGSASKSWDSRKSGSFGSRGSGSGSDSLSWRKDGPFLLKTGGKQTNKGEVTSPLKQTKDRVTTEIKGDIKRILFPASTEEKSATELRPSVSDSQEQV
jgi:hypothetical protein